MADDEIRRRALSLCRTLHPVSCDEPCNQCRQAVADDLATETYGIAVTTRLHPLPRREHSR